jgi:hypothetical protein
MLLHCLLGFGFACLSISCSNPTEEVTWLRGSNFLFGTEEKPAPRLDVMGLDGCMDENTDTLGSVLMSPVCWGHLTAVVGTLL